MTISLRKIHIYPVKALGGIALSQSRVTSRGLQNDRRFLVIDADHQFLTQREHPKMATVWVEIENGEVIFSAPDMETVSFSAAPKELPTRTVQVWSSHVRAQPVRAEADKWLSDYLGADVHLVYMPDSAERQISPAYSRIGEIVSFADGYPLLIVSEASLADLNTRIVANGGVALPMNRFRPNLVIGGCEAFAEDRLGEVAIGESVFRAVKPCARCQVTTTDQADGVVRGPEPLQTLAMFRDSPNGVLFGMNLIPVKLGSVKVGDRVTLPR
ncbi:MAG: MOSC domain-containing protein [Burkholderiales bacterium]|nr:MOSC domain-containing protein [Burkholderiales bacterium]